MDTPERQIAKLFRDNRELTRQVEQLQARVDAAVQALRASRKADEAKQDWDEMMERAVAEGWDNDPTGSSHITSAGMRYQLAHETFIALRDAAITAPPSSSDPGRNDSKGIAGDTGREER